MTLHLFMSNLVEYGFYLAVLNIIGGALAFVCDLFEPGN